MFLLFVRYLHGGYEDVKDGTDDEAVAFLHIHRGKFLVALWNVGDEGF